jgi:hypothetical protein
LFIIALIVHNNYYNFFTRFQFFCNYKIISSSVVLTSFGWVHPFHHTSLILGVSIRHPPHTLEIILPTLCISKWTFHGPYSSSTFRKKRRKPFFSFLGLRYKSKAKKRKEKELFRNLEASSMIIWNKGMAHVSRLMDAHTYPPHHHLKKMAIYLTFQNACFTMYVFMEDFSMDFRHKK